MNIFQKIKLHFLEKALLSAECYKTYLEDEQKYALNKAAIRDSSREDVTDVQTFYYHEIALANLNIARKKRNLEEYKLQVSLS